MYPRVCCLVISFFLISFSSAWASPWAVVANSGYQGDDPTLPDFESEAVYTLDLGKNPPQVHGPFLAGKLVPLNPVTHEPVYGGNLFDVTPIPGTNDALVCNFGGMTLYRINFSNPTNPVLVGSVLLDDGTKSLTPEDIVVTSNGKLAIVSNGGFTDHIAFIDLDTLTLKAMFTLYEGVPFDPASPPDPLPDLFYANATAITPDNQTVIMADYFGGRVVFGKINAAGNGLESVQQIPLCPNWDSGTKTCGADDYKGGPVNISISPDGKTAVTADAAWGMAHVLRITGPGTVVKGTPFELWGLPDTYADFLSNKNSGGHISRAGNQSVAFTPGGGKGYLLQCNTKNVTGNAVDGWVYDETVPDQLSWIRIDGPGQAAVGGVWVADLLSNTSSQFFGVDTLAISEDGKFAYTGNPTFSGAVKNVSRVDLNAYTTSTAPTNCSFPTGIGILARGFNWPMFLPAITHRP